jgi:hypothetical protein
MAYSEPTHIVAERHKFRGTGCLALCESLAK